MNMKFKGKKSTSKKIRFITFIMLSLVISLTAFLSIRYFILYSKNSSVFSIDGEPVSRAEFLNVMSGLKAEVYSEFVSKHENVDNAKFWVTSFNGEVPVEVLKQKTLDKLKRIKIEQMLFKENGIVDDISYSGFLKALDTENATRRRKLANKEVIYGPEQYSAEIYYDYLQGNRNEELKNKLVKKKLFYSDNEVNQFYMENREKLYKNIDSITFEKISVPYTNDNGSTLQEAKTFSENLIKQIRSDVENGGDFGKTAEKYKENGMISVDYKKIELNEKNYREYTSTIPGLINTLGSLKVGQISDILDSGNSFSTIKILQISSSGYKALDVIKDTVISDLIKKKCDEIVDRKLKKAKVTINWKTYNKISQ